MKKNNIIAGIIVAVGFILLMAAVIFLRFVYAKLVYHDARCTFAECRIQK